MLGGNMRKIINNFIGLTIVIALGTVVLGGCGKKEEPVEMPSVEESVEEAPEESSEPEPVVIVEESEEEMVEVTPEPEPVEEIPEGMAKSILTGEYVPAEIGTRRPVAFMIDNVSGAFPHYGTSAASVYYEAPVEAELTRECAIFENWDDQQRIGSLRSCRDYFISYAAGFDSIYVHYGQAAYALPYLESDDVDNISGLASYTDMVFYRANDISAPHNAYASADGIKRGIEHLGYSTELPADFKGSFNYAWVGQEVDLSFGASDIYYVTPGYETSHSYFVYNPDDCRYYRYQYGEPEVDGANGEQLSVTNIILEYQNGCLYDTSVYQHFDTTSGGKGKYISKGKCVDITWTRESFYSPAKYYLADGSELVMNTGKTWVSVIKNKFLGNAKMGPSAEEAYCIEDEATVAQAVEGNAAWEADFKANEAEYRAALDQVLAEELAAHGGQTKVEEALYR
jgi:hypothetical protein